MVLFLCLLWRDVKLFGMFSPPKNYFGIEGMANAVDKAAVKPTVEARWSNDLRRSK